MDSPQNEIPRQLMEELIETNDSGLDDLVDSLINLTGVNSIRLHRITDLEQKLGPSQIQVPVNTNTKGIDDKDTKVNLGVVENLNLKIRSLESMLEFQKKKSQEMEEESNNLKNLLSEYKNYMDKQNEKLEQLELHKIKDSNVPKKNQLVVEEILNKEIILKYNLIDDIANGYYVILYKEGSIFCEKQHLPLKPQAEIYFNKPEAVDTYYFKLYNPKNEVLATSQNFIISPKITFGEPIFFDNFIEINGN